MEFMSSGYDPHFLVYKLPKSGEIKGMFAFNVDTMVQK